MAEKIKMTEREFLEAFLEGHYNSEKRLPAMLEKAQTMIDAIDRRNAKSKEKRKTSPKVDNSTIKQAIGEFLQGKEESVLVADIAEALELSSPKVTAVIRQMVLDGKVERIELNRNKPLEYRLK